MKHRILTGKDYLDFLRSYFKTFKTIRIREKILGKFLL